MKKHTLKEKFQYWFDNRMAHGSRGLINIVILSTLAISLISMCILKIIDKSLRYFDAFWRSLYTLLNAWVPEPDDDNKLFLLFVAIVGILITSVLIGIITNIIEEKIVNLKRGNSLVLEDNHIVVLGFFPGEYTLINQLILAADNKPMNIVVAGDLEKDEMEELISSNIDIPKNIHIICRSIDIFDPVELERLSIENCKTVIVHPMDDNNTIKALLAVSKIINNATNEKVRVGAIVSKEEYQFPPTVAVKHNVTTLHVHRTIAKIIAHSCTQPGISEVFKEIFNFEGNEFYVIDIPGIKDMSFFDLMGKLESGVPVGIERNGLIITNPNGNSLLKEDDRILVFSNTASESKLLENRKVLEVPKYKKEELKDEDKEKTLIIGKNRSLKTILKELPENINEVYIANANVTDSDLEKYAQANPFIKINIVNDDLSEEEGLLNVIKDFNHIVILSSHEMDVDSDDIKNIYMLLRLRDLRTRFNLDFNITAEMRKGSNQQLVVDDDNTDFVVSSNMSSLFLAQLSESPELLPVFTEILSNEGNEVYLKTAYELHCMGNKTIAELRQIALSQGYIMLGYRKKNSLDTVFNPPLDTEVELNHSDFVVVIGEN